MGKRYYCDFCDKKFPYNTANRKKHNEGSSHQAIRNAYYANYKGKQINRIERNLSSFNLTLY